MAREQLHHPMPVGVANGGRRIDNNSADFSIAAKRSRTVPRSHMTKRFADGVSTISSASIKSTLKPRSAKASPTRLMMAASSSMRPGE